VTTDQDQRAVRRRELNRKTKAQLCAMFRQLGFIGGAHPLEQWTKDEIIFGIIDQENALAKAKAAEQEQLTGCDRHCIPEQNVHCMECPRPSFKRSMHTDATGA
jgi:hypothetical protein